MANGPNMLNRVNLQPRLVTLIAGLRYHQVEEAMALLLDYVDSVRPTEPCTPAAPTGFVLLLIDPPQEMLDRAMQAYAAASRSLAKGSADRAAYRALLAAARELQP